MYRLIAAYMSLLMVIVVLTSDFRNSSANTQLEFSNHLRAQVATCVGFDTLPSTAIYKIGNSFTEAGVKVQVVPYISSGGTAAEARVKTTNAAGGTGQEIGVNYVNLEFNFGGPVDGLSFLFREGSTNHNIGINGSPMPFTQFLKIHQTTIGGVNVSVTTTPGTNNKQGAVDLKGKITSFSIGGVELSLNSVCSKIDIVTPTHTPITSTATSTRTATATQTSTATQTATYTTTATPTTTPTGTSSPTVTASPTDSPTATTSPTETSTPTEKSYCNSNIDSNRYPDRGGDSCHSNCNSLPNLEHGLASVWGS